MTEMFYVERQNGRIVALYGAPQPGQTEPDPLPETDTEVQAFLNPPAPPPPLTARQLRLGLIANGISLSAVDTAIANIEDATARASARVEWEYASLFVRAHPLVDQIGAALGLAPAEIDAMWQGASTL
jgi:hypothetical protein